MDVTTASGLAIVAALAAYGGAAELYRLWKYRHRVLHSDVLIGFAMRRVGVSAADAARAKLGRELPRAAERCRVCEKASDCRLRLARIFPQPLPQECLNSRLFESIKDQSAEVGLRERPSTA